MTKKVKVKVNLPTDLDLLDKKLSETLSQILVNKLQPKEIKEFINVLKDDHIQITL